MTVIHPSTLDNNDGQITGLSVLASVYPQYQLEFAVGNGAFAALTEQQIIADSITNLSPGSYYLRYGAYTSPEDESYSPSQPIELIVKGNVAAPEGLIAVAPTSSAQNNGKITGTNPGLEYRSVAASVYESIPLPGLEITGLAPGNYLVRYKETDSNLASAATTVTVPAYVAPPAGGDNNGGSGGNNNDGDNEEELPLPEGVTASGDGAAAEVTAEYNEEAGAAIAVVSDEIISGLLAVAKKLGSEGKSANLEIKVEDSEQSGNIQVTIYRSAFNELAAESDVKVTVNVGFGAITFDSAALKAIDANTDGGDISFILNKFELTEEGKAVLGDRPVYDLLVYAGQSNVTSFGGAEVFVALPYTLQGGEDGNALIVYYVNDEGGLEVIRGHYNAATRQVEFKTLHFSQYIIGYNKIDFDDVASSSWYANAVTYLAARGITNGTDEGRFSPNLNVTRGQFIVLLLNAYGIAPEVGSVNNFVDAGNTYYTGYLAAAKRLGIANGFEGNRFAPEQSISRQDLFTLLYRALNVIGELPSARSGAAQTGSFADAGDISNYAQEAFEALVQGGVVSGANGKLLPRELSSRAEVAQVLYNLLSR